MNNFNIDGIVVSIGERKSAKAPIPCMIQIETKKGEYAHIPLTLFNNLKVGDGVCISGMIDSFEYKGRFYPCLQPKSVTVFARASIDEQ